MKFVRASMTIPEDIYEEAKKFSDNFSSLITEALREYLKNESVKRAVESFGSWKETEESGVDFVNKTRDDSKRPYASRNN